MDITSVVNRFCTIGNFVDALPHGSGHINDTFLVRFLQGGAYRQYIFQRINHRVFPDPPAMMENIVRVTKHIRSKLENQGLADVSRRVLTVVPTVEQRSFHRDEDGCYWRVYDFIERARSYDVLHSEDQAYRVAWMFGDFQAMLHDFPAPPLHEIIPGFHHGPGRLEAFGKALAADVANRALAAKSEIDFVSKCAAMMNVFRDEIMAGRLPIRPAHNDTKINNVMLDAQTGEGLCVIDLDTVMPGLSLYDFGDLARTTLSSTAEDERDLAKIHVEIPRFRAILKGYTDGAGDVLTQAEKSFLVFSAQYITLIIGLRFLTDYLNGDAYFKVRRPGQNLDRARAQFCLVQSIMDNEETLQGLVQY